MSDGGTTERLLSLIDGGRVPRQWRSAKRRIAGDFEALGHLLDAGTDGYGVTTGVGHRDHDHLADIKAFQDDLLASHALPGLRWSTHFQSRCVSVVKAQQLSTGGTGCAPAVYEAVIEAAADGDFAPRVPLDATYSSGDVICGAWWAQGLLDREPIVLGAKGALSLVNGSFVHLGTALALLGTAQDALKTYRTVAAGVMTAGRAKEAHAFPGTPVSEPASRLGQDPVAIRAAADVLDVLERTVTTLREALERELERQSDNPLVVDGRYVEQASFLALPVAMATSGLADALMLAGTWLDRAVTWLTYEAGGLPKDLAEDGRLGLIQVPKLVAAHVHRLREVLAPRPFTAGGSTSHDIEDLWSHGVMSCVAVSDGLAVLHELLALTAAVVGRSAQVGGAAEAVELLGLEAPPKVFAEAVEAYRAAFSWRS